MLATRLTPALRRTVVARSLHATARSLGGGHHDSTLEPPFHRLPLPNKPVSLVPRLRLVGRAPWCSSLLPVADYPLQLHEQDELIWNDGVAPETALDLDAPHISAAKGLVWWLGGFAFFYSVFRFAKATGHPGNKPSVSDLCMLLLAGRWPYLCYD